MVGVAPVVSTGETPLDGCACDCISFGGAKEPKSLGGDNDGVDGAPAFPAMLPPTLLLPRTVETGTGTGTDRILLGNGDSFLAVDDNDDDDDDMACVVLFVFRMNEVFSLGGSVTLILQFMKLKISFCTSK